MKTTARPRFSAGSVVPHVSSCYKYVKLISGQNAGRIRFQSNAKAFAAEPSGRVIRKGGGIKSLAKASAEESRDR